MTVTFRTVEGCDGFARYPDFRAARKAWRGHPARRLMAARPCAECGCVHVRRAD